jgi:hypothetical protein
MGDLARRMPGCAAKKRGKHKPNHATAHPAEGAEYPT